MNTKNFFNQLKTGSPKTRLFDYFLHNHVDSSNVATGCVLIQQFPERKRKNSFSSRFFYKAVQRMSTLHREFSGRVSASQTYKHYFIGFLFLIFIDSDDKPILHLWWRRVQLSHRFIRHQEIITPSQNLRVIWTPRSNLVFRLILSQNPTWEGYQNHQLLQKKIPRHKEFYDEHGSPVFYRIQQDDNPNDTCNDFCSLYFQLRNDK